MRFRMDPRAKLYLLLLANLMLFFHVSLAAEAIMAALFLLLFFLSGCYAAGLRLTAIYGVLLVLGCVCSSALPHWLWEKISKNTVAKLLVFALLTALCVCYVVAATNATALYANF